MRAPTPPSPQRGREQGTALAQVVREQDTALAQRGMDQDTAHDQWGKEQDTALAQRGKKQDPALAQRKKEPNPPLTLTGLYNVLAALREGRALSAKEKAIHTQGLVGVLRELHDELDAAVLAAYSLPAAASTDDILTHLVQLNTQRAAEEAQGRVRWLRPEFQNPQESLQKQELPAHVQQALEGDFGNEKPLSQSEQSAPVLPRTAPVQHPWPATLPEQVRAVAEALARSPTPLTLHALEQCFKGRGPWKKGLPLLLQTLEALGRAQRVEHGQDPSAIAWRG